MFNFLNNYNKFLFSSSVGGDQNSEDQVNTKRSALKTSVKNLVQKTKQLGSLAKENTNGIAFASAGTALTGFGLYKTLDEISKTRASVFGNKASKFHEFYNANKEILGIPGVDSFLSGTNKDLILNFLNLKDQSLINTLLGNQSLFTNNNALSLFQNNSFLNLINTKNSNSLNLLFNNLDLFSNTNINLMNVIMENQGLKTLLNNDGFKNLLNDEKFLSLLQDPEGLKKFFQGAQQLIDDKYLNVLNDPVLSGIFKNQEIQNLLTNPEMLAMLKNPEFFALFSDPNIAPFLTNPDFQALLMGNPDLIKNLLSNPDILKFLNTPEALHMLQNPQLARLLQNQVSSDAFFEMLKNPEMLQNVLKSGDLTNYLEASANVGVSTGAMAGIIISILVGIILTGVGIKMFKTKMTSDSNLKKEMKSGSGEQQDKEMKSGSDEQQDKEKNKITKLFDKIMTSLSNLFSKVIGLFKKKEITSKEVGEVSNEMGNINNNITKLNNLIPENQTLTIGGSAVYANLHTSQNKYTGYYPVEEKLSIEKNDGIEKIKEKINQFIIDNIIELSFQQRRSSYEKIISNVVDELFSESQNKNMNKDQATKLFDNIINQSLEEIKLNYPNETNVPRRFEITSTEFVEKQKEQGPELK